MAKLSPGIKAFRENVRKMKQVGVQHAKARAKQAVVATRDHLAVMDARAQAAAEAKAARAAAGVARRDAHNARLIEERREREQRRHQTKLNAA